ncbi:MAG: hypothetical protein RLZZ35_927, partial [Actinomycetota bacterium]
YERQAFISRGFNQRGWLFFAGTAKGYDKIKIVES